MYKTIRHGENSLQYTILPQNDDFRLEGKIKAGGSAGSKKNKAKKPKGRSFFAYLGLLFVCTVIIGAVLVPFLVSAECLPNPTEWFQKTKNAFSKRPTGVDVKPNVPIHLNTQTNTKLNKGNLALNVGKPVKIINKDGVEKFILKVNKSLTTEAPTIANGTAMGNIVTVDLNQSTIENNSVFKTLKQEAPIQVANDNTNENEHDNIANSIRQTALVNETPVNTIKSLPAPTTLSDILVVSTVPTIAATTTFINRNLSSASVPNVPRSSLQSSLNQHSNNSSTQPTITTRIMQVPLLKSTAKKPAIPPVLVKNLSPIQPTPDAPDSLNDILPPKAADPKAVDGKNTPNADWIHNHWPFIDPSTYFQWNGYKTEDSVLLPALLGFALIGVILIITVCLVARNKRTIVTSVRKRNRNDLEESGADDNTTLLTNSNLSDED